MTTYQSSRGFGAVEAIIIVVVIFIVGALGIVGYKQFTKPAATTVNATAPATVQPIGQVVAAPATVESTADLNAAQKAVDDTSTDGDTTDLGQLDSQSADF